MKRKVSEKFEIGKANMEFPNYEIKIEGQTPITYADAINNRIKNVEKVEKDFQEKNKIMHEFESENQKRFNESVDKQLVDKFMEYHEYPNNYSNNQEGFLKVYDMLDKYATDDENPDNMTVDELFVRAPISEQKKMIALIMPKVMHKESFDMNSKLYKQAENVSSMLSNFIDELNKIDTTDFIVDSDIEVLNRAVEALDGFATAYSYIMDNEDVFESVSKCPNCDKEKCTCEDDQEQLEEAGKVTAELRKPRVSIRKEDKLYSRDDVWAKVYDELSSEVENEGPKGEIYKEVDIPRGKRFIGPYTGPGNDDLTVYAHVKEDLKWAKKIADHFGLKIDMKEDKNKSSNRYYPFYAILRNVSDAKVSDEEMEDYLDEMD